MIENQPQKIGFALKNITNEQFAIIDEGFNEKGQIGLGTELNFGIDVPKKMISVFTAFTFDSDKNPFLKIEVGGHFEILEPAWSQMVNNELNLLEVPKNFMRHLAVITVGTARGVLFTKTENTCFNIYILPTINLVDIIKEDITFKFET